MRAQLVGATLLVFCSCKKSSLDADSVEMIELVRPPVALSVPKWPVVEDARDPAVGKHKVERSKRTREFVEVSWQGGEPMSAADLEALGRATIESFKLKLIEDGTTAGTDEIRYRLLATLGQEKKTVWMAMALIQCGKTNVTVTVGAGTWSRKASVRLLDRVLADFRCIGDSPERFRPTRVAPSSTLPESFGYVEVSSNAVVANAEGLGIFVFAAGGDTSGAIREHPEKALDMMSTMFEIPITNVGKPRAKKGVGGVQIWMVDARSEDGPIAAASYYCREARTTFMLLAMKDPPPAAGELEGAVTQFGCPGAAPPISSRKSACEVGATGFCETPP